MALRSGYGVGSLGPRGESYVFDAPPHGWSDEPGRPLRLSPTIEVCSMRLADLSVRRATRVGSAHDQRIKQEAVGSPVDDRAALAEAWSTWSPGQQAGPDHAHYSVSIVAFDGSPPLELVHGVGTIGGSNEHLPVAWSPDGTLLAVSLITTWGDFPYFPEVLVFDTRTGEQAHRLPGAGLVGSAPWSPDGGRLLVHYTPQVRVHDLTTGEDEEPAALPLFATATPAPGAHRPLGLAGPGTALTVVQRGKTQTLQLLDLDTGSSRAVLRWTGDLDMYPRLATMPAGYWADLPEAYTPE